MLKKLAAKANQLAQEDQQKIIQPAYIRAARKVSVFYISVNIFCEFIIISDKLIKLHAMLCVRFATIDVMT